MKVRITRCNISGAWYASKVGQVFVVMDKDDERGVYFVVPVGGESEEVFYSVPMLDCEPLPDTPQGCHAKPRIEKDGRVITIDGKPGIGCKMPDYAGDVREPKDDQPLYNHNDVVEFLEQEGYQIDYSDGKESINAESLLIKAARLVEKNQAHYGDAAASWRQIIDIFNRLTGHNLKHEEGPLLLRIMKMVREQTESKFDNYLDDAGYLDVQARIKFSEKGRASDGDQGLLEV